MIVAAAAASHRLFELSCLREGMFHKGGVADGN